MYKVHARVSLGASGLQAVEKVVEVMYTLQLCDEVNQCPSSLVPNWIGWTQWTKSHQRLKVITQGGVVIDDNLKMSHR